MISEKFFSSHYSSVWRSLTPTLDEVVRQWNMSGYDRIWPPISSGVNPERRGLVNEAAFVIFCKSQSESRSTVLAADSGLVSEAFSEALQYLRLPEGETREIQEVEKSEAVLLAARLGTLGRSNFHVAGVLSIRPAFKGCGIIDSCFGDFIKGDYLFEVKAGDRPFRSIDYRQILMYLSLNYCAGGGSIPWSRPVQSTYWRFSENEHGGFLSFGGRGYTE